jgi:hypothetical protein
MSCASLGCKPQDFEFKWSFSPTHQSAAKRPIGAWGKGVRFSNYLGFAPQAVTIRASGTKKRNFKKRERGTLEQVLLQSSVKTNGSSWVVSLASAAG